MSNQNNLGKIMQFLAQTANPIDGNQVNRPYLINKVYKAMGFRDAELALLPPPPPMQQQLPQVGSMPGPGGGQATPQPGAGPTQGPIPEMLMNPMGGQK